MGSCGCIESLGDAKFQGPGDSFYTISIYPGCPYCNESPGVILGHVRRNDPEYDSLCELPDVKIGGVFGLLPFDLGSVQTKLKELFAKESEAAQIAVEDLTDNELLRVMQESCHELTTKWKSTLTYPKRKKRLK